MKTKLFLSVAFLALVSSCKKDSDNGGPDSPTAIEITLPTPNQILLNGSNLKIEGTITDNNIIANASVQVRNKNTGAVLFSAQVTTANVSFYRFLWNWTVSGVTASMTATVKVTGRDVQGGESFKEVDILLEP